MSAIVDEVVREVDVYLTEDLSLYLLQFPLKPVYADSIDISSARIKPQHKKIELDVPLVLPENYPRESLRDIPKSQKYQSSTVAHDVCLGAAIIKDNNMYITPIQNVLQLRPSFKNMQSFRGEVVEQMDEDQPEGEFGGDGGDGEGMQQVQLKRKESERAQSARIQSFAYIQAQEEQEAWRELEVHPIGTVATVYIQLYLILSCVLLCCCTF